MNPHIKRVVTLSIDWSFILLGVVDPRGRG